MNYRLFKGAAPGSPAGKTTNRTKLLICFAVVLLSYIAVAAFYPMQYYTHDETDIQSALAGNFSGTPYPAHPYINIILGRVLSGLYTIIPRVQWWYVYGTILLVGGMMLIFYSVLRVAERAGVSLPTAILLIVGIDCTFTVYLIANSAYTLIGAVFGTGLCSVFFWLKECTKSQAKRYFWLCLGGYFLIHIYRKETGEAILCFLLLSVLYYLFSVMGLSPRMIGSFIAVCAVFVALTAGLLGIKEVTDNKYNGEDYEAFFEAWRGLRDNPFDTIEENPRLYEEAGWGEYEYWMLRSYRGTSDKMTIDSYNYIHDNSLAVTAYRRNIYNNIVLAFRSREFRGLLFGYMALVFIGLCALAYNFNLPYLVFMLFNNGGFGIMSAYLILFRGRFLFRAAYVVFLPAMVINILLIMGQRKKEDPAEIPRGEAETPRGKAEMPRDMAKLSNMTAAVLVYITTISISALSLYGYFYNTGERREALERCRLITAYELEHKDEAFICLGNTYENYDPWTTFGDNKPTNNLYGFTFRWGACIEQLRANGLGTENESLQFTADHTRLLTDWDMSSPSKKPIYYNNSFSLYLDYLKEFYGCRGFVETGMIPGTDVHIYRYLFGEAVNEYDTIYDIVDNAVVEIKP